MPATPADCGLILVIDDDAGVRTLVSQVLSAGGYRMLEAAGGLDGLDLVAMEAPDLVVLDIVMPDLSGYEVCRRLRAGEGAHGLPILFVSGVRTDPLDRAAGLLLGLLRH